MMDGGCYCGAVRFRMEDAPIFVNGCHCRNCQKLTGSAFAINAMIERERVALTSGEGSVVDHDGAASCAECRTLLWATHPMFGLSILFLRVGTLDDNERFQPRAHFFTRSKHPWVILPAGVQSYDTLPGDGDPPVLDAQAAARVAAAQAAIA